MASVRAKVVVLPSWVGHVCVYSDEVAINATVESMIPIQYGINGLPAKARLNWVEFVRIDLMMSQRQRKWLPSLGWQIACCNLAHLSQSFILKVV